MATKSLGALGKGGLLVETLGATNTGALVTTPACSAATAVSVASAAAATTLRAANPARKGLAVFNESTSALLLKAGTSPSATSYTVRIAAGGYYEMPYGYTGAVTGLWEAANGAARITEFT